MKAKIKLGKKQIEFRSIKKATGLSKISGLMFKSADSEPLLFEFNRPTGQSIHSFFCPEFLAVWLDEKNKIIEYKIIKKNQFSVKPKQKFKRLLEIPLNKGIWRQMPSRREKKHLKTLFS